MVLGFICPNWQLQVQIRSLPPSFDPHTPVHIPCPSQPSPRLHLGHPKPSLPSQQHEPMQTWISFNNLDSASFIPFCQFRLLNFYLETYQRWLLSPPWLPDVPCHGSCSFNPSIPECFDLLFLPHLPLGRRSYIVLHGNQGMRLPVKPPPSLVHRTFHVYATICYNPSPLQEWKQ